MLTKHEIYAVFGNEKIEREYNGDGCVQGLLIFCKYKNMNKESVIRKAYDNMIFSISLEEACNMDMSVEDIASLKILGWKIFDPTDEFIFTII